MNFCLSLPQRVFTLSTTTDKNAIDHALLRPGRIELQVQTDRISLRAKEDIFRDEIPSGISLEAVRERLADMTGAEIRGFCRELKLRAFRRGSHTVSDDDLDLPTTVP
mmetsp:Transcript_19073/g.27639  ORF Transcript_19073/g.27639 Transcript_19073/m.27639 type:complete len:108 (-) Transcript_19073:94-417(-)